MKTVYTAFSKHNYYAKSLVSAYVLNQKCVPLNPFMNWGYFLDDLVERDMVREANHHLIKISDEIWQFGDISNGCYYELTLAMNLNHPIRFFTVSGHLNEIKEIQNVNEIAFEDELVKEIGVETFREELANYLQSKNAHV